jgi:hypothetical protein
MARRIQRKITYYPSRRGGSTANTFRVLMDLSHRFVGKQRCAL